MKSQAIFAAIIIFFIAIITLAQQPRKTPQVQGTKNKRFRTPCSAGDKRIKSLFRTPCSAGG
jgi:hypothetical protein